MKTIKITKFSQIEMYQEKMIDLQKIIDTDFDLLQQKELKRIAGVMLEELQLEIVKFEEIIPSRLKMLHTVKRSLEYHNLYRYSHLTAWRIVYRSFFEAMAMCINDLYTEKYCVCRTRGYLVIPENEFELFFGDDADRRNIIFQYDPRNGKRVEKEFRLVG